MIIEILALKIAEIEPAFMGFAEPVRIALNSFSTQAFEVLILPVAVFSIFFYLLGLTGFFSHKKSFKKTPKKLPKVTVQIPTFNESVALRCAKACLKFDYPKKMYEIIIGDDSTDPGVSRLIDNFERSNKSRIKVTRRGSNTGFKAGNLNHMLKHSKGDLIVIFDSDFIPPRNFLRRVVEPFADGKVAAVQSKWTYLNMAQSKTSKFAATVLMVYHNLLARLNSSMGIPLLFGSGQAVRKSVLVKLGGWQEGSVTEDVEFSVRLLTKGYRTVYLNDLTVAGEVPFNPKSLRIQQRKWAYGNMKTFMDHKRSILFGKFSKLQKLFLLATLTGYISSFFLVAFMFFGAVAFFTGTPAPVDILRLSADVLKNFLIASGFTFAGIIALSKEKKLHHVFVIFFTALTVGILVSLSVSNGIIRAVRGKKMYWTMIPKMGNTEFGTAPLSSYTPIAEARFKEKV